MTFVFSEPLDCLAAVQGYRFAATASGIRRTGNPDRLDLGILYSEIEDTTGAAVFTQNDFAAAPVLLSRAHLKASSGNVRGWVVNSGNANACTGTEGELDARHMLAAAADAAGLPVEKVLICSTGRIGDRLPMGKILPAISGLRADLDRSAPEDAARLAEAILTSDTRPKTILLEGEFSGKIFRLAGIAKGAGMIEPNMATMLAFVTTDLAVPADILQRSLKAAVDVSFNRITIDGDQSTNDTVIALANGASGISWTPELEPVLLSALTEVCRRLARKIVADGEKITRVVTVQIKSAVSDEQALTVARCIANSLLVKSSWYGGDPNWGRLLDAAGYAGAGLTWEGIDLFYEDVPVISRGQVHFEKKETWREVVNRKEFTLSLHLNQGDGSSEVWTTDLSEAYVNFNKSE